jgi:hypothetical protein
MKVFVLTDPGEGGTITMKFEKNLPCEVFRTFNASCKNL